MPIMIVLLNDRIFYDHQGKEQKNAFAKVVVALAHEIYGNVQQLLEKDINQMKPMTSIERQRLEVNAFETSIRFLTGLKSNARFATLAPKHPLRPYGFASFRGDGFAVLAKGSPSISVRPGLSGHVGCDQ